MLLVAIIAFAGFVFVKGSQPMGMLDVDPGGETSVPSSSLRTGLSDLNYWEFMADRLAASRATPANCHRARLIFLTIALPVYPAVYTYVALYPESSLAHHVQPNPLIPNPISWSEAPETWWQLVKEISWLAFTQPQMDYTPAVGQRVGVDQNCILPPAQPRITK